MLSLNTHSGPLCTSFCAPDTTYAIASTASAAAAASRSGPGRRPSRPSAGRDANEEDRGHQDRQHVVVHDLPGAPPQRRQRRVGDPQPDERQVRPPLRDDQQRAREADDLDGDERPRRRGAGVPAHHRQAVAERSGTLGDQRPVAGGEAQGDDGRQEDLDLRHPEPRTRRHQALVDPCPEPPHRSTSTIVVRPTSAHACVSTSYCAGDPVQPHRPHRRRVHARRRRATRGPSRAGRPRARAAGPGTAGRSVTRTGFVSATSSGSSVPSRCSATSSSRVWSAVLTSLKSRNAVSGHSSSWPTATDGHDARGGTTSRRGRPWPRARCSVHRPQLLEEDVRLGLQDGHRQPDRRRGRSGRRCPRARRHAR